MKGYDERVQLLLSSKCYERADKQFRINMEG